MTRWPVMAADPAHRHGGPGAGWYRPLAGGWLRVSDADAANERWPDMRHFMTDPNEDGHGDPQQAPPVGH
jgi:hypothetical protein